MTRPELARAPDAAPTGVGAATLESLALPTAPLRAETPIVDVAQAFLEARHAGLLSLPIIDGRRRPVGSISRYALMRVFLQPFGRELFGKRPIASLMNRDPLVMSDSTPLDLAARAVADKIPSPITDDFIIVGESGSYVGTGLVLDVLRAVERRLADRGRELEGAYTRLKSSQTQLVQSEKMASLGQMVAGLVHEINTPLGYVRNNVEMTKASLADIARLVAAQDAALEALIANDSANGGFEMRLAEVDIARGNVDASTLADMSDLLGDALHGVDRIGELVTDLKDFSRLDQGIAQKADVNQLVRSAMRIADHVTRKRGVEVVHEPGVVSEIDCAPAQINQVLLNLLTNAAQAIEHDRGRIVVRTQQLDHRVLISVEDNGKGIAEVDLARIFDPFFTTKAVGQGTGLGLAISHQIVERHGGAIRVMSKPGIGTRFLIVLPLRVTHGKAS